MAFATINKGSSYFNTVTYSGNGSTQSITNVGFKPDLVWIKCRTNTYTHLWYDVRRGAGIFLQSPSTNGEGGASGDLLGSFDTNGFQVNNTLTPSTNPSTNGSGETFVAWNWLASNTTGSSNTSGTITSTVSVNTTPGFSILTYTGNGTSGATVGHGLGVTPACYIVKCRNTNGTNWSMYHQSLGNTKAMVFTATGPRTTAVYWNNTSPTSTVFSLGNDNDVNVNTQTYVAYCFAEIKGYSKFGSYVGNGSSNGTFVYTGFKPAFIMIKETGTSGNWLIQDNKRLGYNASNAELYANLTSAESTADRTDLLSNGFKARINSGENNGSGLTYIYMAFAENPFVLTDGTPVTAR